MDFNEVINKRVTSREWTDKEVDFEAVKRIISAGMKAPCWDHWRNWQFIVLHIWMLLFSGIYVFAYSINTIVVCGVFPAGGDSVYDAKSVLVASWLFALPLALLGTFVFNLPVIVIYIFMCADEIVKLPFIIPRYKKYIWLKNLTREEVAE